jgi:hypothetical protein
MGEQFRTLVVEPFIHLKFRNGSEPRAIVIDGLDGYGGDPNDKRYSDSVQCDLVRLVSRFTLQHPEAPFIWIIASRPESHLKAVFSELDVTPSFWKEDIPVDSEEARRDVEKFLDHEFTRLRQQYPSVAELPWPNSDQLSKVTNFTLGLFVLARAIIQFIGDPSFTNPVAQLETCIRAIDSTSLPGAGNLFEYPHNFYLGILKNTSVTVRPITMRILAFLVLRVEKELPAQAVANILFLDQATFYASLRSLHSVLDIPKPSSAGDFPIENFHPSFQCFIHQLVVEGHFGQDRRALLADIQTSYYQWCNIWGRKPIGGASTKSYGKAYIP